MIGNEDLDSVMLTVTELAAVLEIRMARVLFETDVILISVAYRCRPNSPQRLPKVKHIDP